MKKVKKVSTKEYLYTVVYEPVKEGGFKVVVPFLPGLITYGRDLEEAREMARDAIRCHVSGLRKDGEDIPYEREMIQERMSCSSRSTEKGISSPSWANMWKSTNSRTSCRAGMRRNYQYEK